MNNISVVVPAVNEEKTIGTVIDDIEAALTKANIGFEIIVVEDGSDDNTYDIIKERKVQIVRHPVCGGYGLSLRDGILKSQYNHIVIIDADGTYPAAQIPELVGGLDQYDMVVGARKGRHYKESFLKHTLRLILQMICEFVAGRRIPDVNSGFMAFKKDVVLKYKETFCLGFSFTTTITLAFHLNGHFIKYIPAAYYARTGRRTHVKFLRDSLRTAQIITQAILYYNPIKLFIMLAFMVFVMAVVAFSVYYVNGSVFLLTIGTAFLVLSFVYLGMGLIAEEMRISKR